MGESQPQMITDWHALANVPGQELKINLCHPDAELPTYATEGAACFDLRAVDINGYTLAEHDVLQKAGVFAYIATINPGDQMQFRTGLKVEVPKGWVLKLYPRSGLSTNHGIVLANSVGIVDSDYRGEVKVVLRNRGKHPFSIRHGERIAQAMLEPAVRVKMVEVDKLSETARGEGGFGSTGV